MGLWPKIYTTLLFLLCVLPARPDTIANKKNIRNITHPFEINIGKFFKPNDPRNFKNYEALITKLIDIDNISYGLKSPIRELMIDTFAKRAREKTFKNGEKLDVVVRKALAQKGIPFNLTRKEYAVIKQNPRHPLLARVNELSFEDGADEETIIGSVEDAQLYLNYDVVRLLMMPRHALPVPIKGLDDAQLRSLAVAILNHLDKTTSTEADAGITQKLFPELNKQLGAYGAYIEPTRKFVTVTYDPLNPKALAENAKIYWRFRAEQAEVLGTGQGTKCAALIRGALEAIEALDREDPEEK